MDMKMDTDTEMRIIIFGGLFNQGKQSKEVGKRCDRENQLPTEDHMPIFIIRMMQMIFGWHINIFEKKQTKENYNNQQPARFDRRKLDATNVFHWDILLWSTEVKNRNEPKALVQFDTMVKLVWNKRPENKTGEVESLSIAMMGFLLRDIPKLSPGCDSKINDLNNISTHILLRRINLFPMFIKAGSMQAVLPHSLELLYARPHNKFDIEEDTKKCDKSSTQETYASL
ncbi:hypothetical protein Tco_0164843 [Tanacetum coccineum]